MAYPLTPITAFNGLNQPSRDNPSTFADWGDAWVAAEATGAQQHNTLAGQVNVMATDAQTNAGLAQTSATNAATSASDAANSAAGAAAAANVTKWVTGTNYTQGAVVWSPTDFQNYRARVALSPSNTDPVSDPANWQALDRITQLITAAGTLVENNYIYGGDFAVTMPSFATKKNFSLTLPANLQAFTNQPVTSDGWTVNMNFSAGNSRVNAPLAFGTAHGWWGSLAMTPPVNATSSAIGNGALTPIASVVLSSTCHVYFFQEAAPATWAIAIDPTTGNMGAPVSLAAVAPAGTPCGAFAVSATSFVIFSSSSVIAGSVSGLTITGGTPLVLGNSLIDIPIQLTATTYLVHLVSTTSSLLVVSISGTTCSAGTAITSGSTGSANARIAPISATTALLVYATASANPTSLTARVVSIAGTTVTLNTTAVSGTSVINGTVGQWGSLIGLSPTSFIFCGVNNTTGTSGSWYGITVSGTTVTIGTVSVQANNQWIRYMRSTFIYRWGAVTGSASWLYGAQVDAATIVTIQGNASGVMFAVSISGTTLTFGASFSTGTPQAILSNMDTGSNLYASGTTSFSKLSFTGVTISAAYTVAVSPGAIFTDTLNDKAANYSGIWYIWTGLPAMAFPISTSKYANLPANILRTYGNFS